MKNKSMKQMNKVLFFVVLTVFSFSNKAFAAEESRPDDFCDCNDQISIEDRCLGEKYERAVNLYNELKSPEGGQTLALLDEYGEKRYGEEWRSWFQKIGDRIRFFDVALSHVSNLEIIADLLGDFLGEVSTSLIWSAYLGDMKRFELILQRERINKRLDQIASEKSSLFELTVLNAVVLLFSHFKRMEWDEPCRLRLEKVIKLCGRYGFSVEICDGSGKSAFDLLLLNEDIHRSWSSFLFSNLPAYRERFGSKKQVWSKKKSSAASASKPLVLSQRQQKKERERIERRRRGRERELMRAEDVRLHTRIAEERWEQGLDRERRIDEARIRNEERASAAAEAAKSRSIQKECSCCERPLGKSAVRIFCSTCQSEYWLNAACWRTRLVDSACDRTRGASCVDLGCSGRLSSM
jgi:hypothetical protein